MAYALRPGVPLDAEVRRIAAEEIEAARAALAGEDFQESVHEVRKRAKRLRGLARAFRPALGQDYARMNAHWRDMARRLSAIRDATALIEILDALAGHFAGKLGDGALDEVRRRLEARRDRLLGQADDPEALRRNATRDLDEGAALAEGLRFGDGEDALVAGIAATYRRGRADAKAAATSDDPHLFHDWRKQVKYHWMHMCLVAPARPGVLGARAEEAKALSDVLGDEHDLTVLLAAIPTEPEDFGDAADRELLTGLALARQASLRRKARERGRSLFAERGRVFAERLAGIREVSAEEAAAA